MRTKKANSEIGKLIWMKPVVLGLLNVGGAVLDFLIFRRAMPKVDGGALKACPRCAGTLVNTIGVPVLGAESAVAPYVERASLHARSAAEVALCMLCASSPRSTI